MMYILTQQEFDDLQEKNDKDAKAAQEVLQDLCTRLANTELVTEGWWKGKAWGCIRSIDKDDPEEWYCDDCPVQKQCPYIYKQWSK